MKSARLRHRSVMLESVLLVHYWFMFVQNVRFQFQFQFQCFSFRLQYSYMYFSKMFNCSFSIQSLSTPLVVAHALLRLSPKFPCCLHFDFTLSLMFKQFNQQSMLNRHERTVCIRNPAHLRTPSPQNCPVAYSSSHSPNTYMPVCAPHPAPCRLKRAHCPVHNSTGC